MFDLKIMTLLSFLLVVCSATLVTAALLRDPMRPAVSSSESAAVTSEQHKLSATWVLQSVLLGADRAVAVIDGTPVSRGESYQGAKLIKVAADSVVLQSSGGKKVLLKLTPGIHKKKLSADREKSLQ